MVTQKVDKTPDSTKPTITTRSESIPDSIVPFDLDRKRDAKRATKNDLLQK